MKLSLGIALRFLKSNRTQTVVIVLGIGIGVAVQIFIGSLIQGLQISLIDKTIGNSSQITITVEQENQLISAEESLVGPIQDADPRIQNVSPVLDTPAFLETDGSSQSVLIRGFDLERADKIYGFTDALTEGTFPKKEGELLIGVAIQEKYQLMLGDSIRLVTPDKRTIEGTVVGVFDLQVAAVNESWCVATYETAQAVAGVDQGFSAIEMQVNQDDVFVADEIANQLAVELADDTLKIDNWKDQNQQLLSGLQGQSISSLMIQVFVMVSVVLGIASVLAITVMQKSRQIGILKAMGIKNRSASLIFLAEGLILGIFGAATGVAFGIGLSASFTKFALNPDGTPVVPLYIDSSFILLSAGIAVVACLVASLIPARKSSKLDPIEIIRNN